VLDTLGGVFAGLFMGGIFPFLGVIARKELAASALLISLITAAPFIGSLASPLWAALAEKRRRIPLVVSTVLATRAVLVLIAFTTTSLTFSLVVTVGLIISAFNAPAYTALMKEIYPDEWRGRITSLVRVGVTISSMVAAAIVGILLTRWSFRLVLPAVAFMTMAGPLIFRLIPEPNPSTPLPSAAPLAASLSVLRQDSLFARFSLAFFIFGFGNLMCGPIVPVFQVDELGITPGWVGMLATTTALSAGVSFYFWGRAVDSRGAIFCALGAMLGWGSVSLGYAVVPSLPWLIPIAALTGVSSSATELAVLNAVMQFAGRDKVPRYSGTHYTLLGVRGVCAPFLGASLLEVVSPRAVFAICTLFILIGFLLMLGVSKEMKKRDEVPSHQ